MTKMSEKNFSVLVTLVVLTIFWLLLSPLTVDIYKFFIGELHHEHIPHVLFLLGSAIISIAIVTVLSHDLMIKKEEQMWLKFKRLLAYIPWELYQILLANLDVAYRSLHPKSFERGRSDGMFGVGPIDPEVIQFETTLRSDLSLVTMANSITLTPGTITILVDPPIGKFWVHAIAKAPGDALLVDQSMQKKVAHVYLEEG